MEEEEKRQIILKNKEEMEKKCFQREKRNWNYKIKQKKSKI